MIDDFAQWEASLPDIAVLTCGPFWDVRVSERLHDLDDVAAEFGIDLNEGD